jgi:hypothetical protein
MKLFEYSLDHFSDMIFLKVSSAFHVGFVINEVVLGQASSEVFGSSLSVILNRKTSDHFNKAHPEGESRAHNNFSTQLHKF